VISYTDRDKMNSWLWPPSLSCTKFSNSGSLNANSSTTFELHMASHWHIYCISILQPCDLCKHFRQSLNVTVSSLCCISWLSIKGPCDMHLWISELSVSYTRHDNASLNFEISGVSALELDKRQRQREKRFMWPRTGRAAQKIHKQNFKKSTEWNEHFKYTWAINILTMCH